ncbi:MAG: NADH:flavin oxidoreductase [Deltaproteobacteria bacterium]|nr:NADH:flavin oxidoreductase [Deltaproteobacteria bacterium]
MGTPATLKVLTPTRIDGLSLRNRIIRTAAFEGMCRGGVPSDALRDHHAALAQGGVAMTTVAYCSVSEDGRTYGHQMWMREAIVPALRGITDAVHAGGAAASIQLGHCGYFASSKVTGERPIAPSRALNLYGLSFSRPMTGADMTRVAADFARSARLAAEAGFDAVELHAGHGYLLSQFLSPFTNRRVDEHGGSLENRLRFPLAVLGAVRDSLGPEFPVIVKMNLEDGFDGGLEIDEAVQAARAFEEGGASALVASGGFVSKTPFYMMRGNVPVLEMVKGQDSWVRQVGLFLFGRIFVQTYPYEDLFFLDKARLVRAAVRIPVVLVGGVTSVAGMERAMSEGFELVAVGRALVKEPDLVARLARGEWQASDCDHCNRCVAEMDRGGVRCVCLDSDV